MKGEIRTAALVIAAIVAAVLAFEWIVTDGSAAASARELVERELFAQTITNDGELWIDVVEIRKMDRPLSPNAIRYVYAVVDGRIALVDEIPGDYVPGEIVRTSAEIRFKRGAR